MSAEAPVGQDARPSSVSAATPSRSHFRWAILALVSVIYMLVAVDRANLGIALPSIKSEFHISNAQAGFFATLMFIAFASAQLPSSLLCRRFGPRPIMTVALVLTAIISFLIGESRTPFDLKLCRFLLGIAESAVSVCCITLLNNWFSNAERGTATGYFWGSSKMGPVLSPAISTAILLAFGWRAIFQTFSIPVLLAALVWALFVRSKPEQSRFVSDTELAHIRSVRPASRDGERRHTVAFPAWIDRLIRYKPVTPIERGKDVFRSWNVYGILFATMFMVGIFNVFLAWTPTYLLNAKHLSVATVGLVTMTPFGGAVAGNFAGGWLSDNALGMRRKPLMLCGALFTAIALIGLMFSPASPWLTGALLLCTGFVVGLGYPHFSTYTMSITSREVYPIAYGFTNVGAAFGSALFPLAAGYILDMWSWAALFLFLSLASLICFGLLLTIDEPAQHR